MPIDCATSSTDKTLIRDVHKVSVLNQTLIGSHEMIECDGITDDLADRLFAHYLIDVLVANSAPIFSAHVLT